MPIVKRPNLELSYHRPEWKTEYANLVKHIKSVVPKNIQLCFMHVGSTAIRGLTARPIIDVAIGVINPLDIITVRDVLAINGYNYNEGRSTIFDIFMEKRGIGQQRFNIHLVEFDGKKWNDMFNLTTLLNENKEVAKKYAEFKTNLLFKQNMTYNEYEARKAEYIAQLLKDRK